MGVRRVRGCSHERHLLCDDGLPHRGGPFRVRNGDSVEYHVPHGVGGIPEYHSEVHGGVDDVDVPQNEVRNACDGTDPTTADLHRGKGELILV